MDWLGGVYHTFSRVHAGGRSRLVHRLGVVEPAADFGEPLGKVPDGYLKWLAAPAQASILKSQKLVALYLSRPDVRKALKLDNS